MSMAPESISFFACEVGFWAAQVGVVGLLAWVTLAGRDRWPFSHYPMFSGTSEAASVRVFELQFSDAVGRPIVGRAEDRWDELQAECEQAGRSANPAWNPVVARHARRASRVNPALRRARVVRLVARTGRVRAAAGVVIEEVVLYSAAFDAGCGGEEQGGR